MTEQTKQPSINEEAMTIVDQFARLTPPKTINLKEVENYLDKMVNQFHVPRQEAKTSVIKELLKKQGVDAKDFYADFNKQDSKKPVKIGEVVAGIGKANWVTIKGTFSKAFDNKSEKVQQTGIIGDETGTIKFTTWVANRNIFLEEGKAYLFENCPVSEYNGLLSITVTKNSEIKPIDETIEVAQKIDTITGAIINIQNGSGLIKRCPECKRAINKDMCAEHGKVQGIYDLRIKANLDDGISVTDLIIDRVLTEKILGFGLEAARQKATELLDMGAITPIIQEKVFGKYWSVSGNKIGDNMIVKEIVPLTFNKEASIAELESMIAGGV